MADVHRGAEPSSQEGRSRFQVTQVLYLLEHHLKYKRHGLIQDKKKLIAEGEKSSSKKLKSPPAKKLKSHMIGKVVFKKK